MQSFTNFAHGYRDFVRGYRNGVAGRIPAGVMDPLAFRREVEATAIQDRKRLAAVIAAGTLVLLVYQVL